MLWKGAQGGGGGSAGLSPLKVFIKLKIEIVFEFDIIPRVYKKSRYNFRSESLMNILDWVEEMTI